MIYNKRCSNSQLNPDIDESCDICAEAVVTQLVQTTVLKIVYNGSNRLQNRVSST